MILLIDIGNTLTKIAIGNDEDQKISVTKKIITKDKNYQKEIKKVLSKIKIKIDNIIISCVAPKKLTIIKKILNKFFNLKPIIVNHQIFKFLPISISVEHPTQIGSDLIALAVASHHLFGNSITISLGTATTYTIIKDHDLKGEIIGPGFHSAKASLMSEAALIKPFKIKPYEILIGKTTNHALSIGYGNGFNYMLKETIKAVNRQLDSSLVTVITGGNFDELKPFLEFNYQYQENLLLLGLIIIYQNLKKNNKLK